MNTDQREHYLFAGYLVTRRFERWSENSPELLPARLLSASPCIARFVPDSWALDWATTEAETKAAAKTFSFDARTVADVTSHVTAGFNEGRFGWPNVIMSTEALVGLMCILPKSEQWVALGLGLHEKHVEAFLKYNSPSDGTGVPGVCDLLARRISIPRGGTLLGFEPLGFAHGIQPHSWICHALEDECCRELNVRPNALGFLDSQDDGERVTNYIASDEDKTEGGQWLPWMILDYTAESRRWS